MVFNENSPMVHNCLFLLDEGSLTHEGIPDFYNLREVVINEYDKNHEILIHNELENIKGGEKKYV